MNKKPICFIAMAFGYEDTDNFYENLLLPVLKKNNITPVIINRHQSNDDLNFTIIQKLKEADFCIVDLTYARPSVYYEAGFASARDIEVIYTARKDHLQRDQPDDRRVHFDVQMKPIIDWKSPDDPSFSRRLEMRITKTFLSKWLKIQKTITKNKKEEEKFRSLSTISRLNKIRELCVEELHTRGYDKKDWIRNTLRYGDYYDKVVRVQGKFENYIHTHKIIGENLYAVSLQAFKSPTKTELIDIHNIYTRTIFLSSAVRKLFEIKKLKKLYVSVFILSLDTVSPTRIETAMLTAMPIEHSKHYRSGNIFDTGFRKRNFINSDFYFFSSIKSENQFKIDLQKLELS